ncbi:MAG TPA: hypothetical protein VGC76_19315, partial [Pyrinomonadaceae bacterium]
ILDIELRGVQDRITESAGTKFVFECTEAAREFLLSEGIDLKYGARHLKRAIERFLVYPLSNLVATEQVETGDLVLIDFDEDGQKLIFSKQSGKMIVSEFDDEMFEDEPQSKSDAVGLPLAEAHAAASGKGNKSNIDNNDG